MAFSSTENHQREQRKRVHSSPNYNHDSLCDKGEVAEDEETEFLQVA